MQTSKPVPAALRAIMLGYEAFEPMVQVELGTWQALGIVARQVRNEVFVNEQGIEVAMCCGP